MLTLHALTKRFGAVTAVDAVSIEIDRPAMVGVIGASGAGKSTLLRMLNLLERPSGGRIVFEGREISALSGRGARGWQSDCAMVFQQFNLVPRLDVVTNVLHGTLYRTGTLRALSALWPEADIRRAIAILERLGIETQVAKRAEALSGGQQQRVAIARALMQEPKMILADEPIASLDPMNAQIVMETLRRIHDEDRRMIVCNLHTLDTARRYCDRVIGMREGRVVFDGPPSALTAAAARDVYGADGTFSEDATSTEIRDADARSPARKAAAAL
ncbi:MAG: phosphonate ABC transporter ATP-binding protein [Paracoccaceae bacterium]